MAHELEFGADGIANVFSTRLPMWHQEGHVLDEAPATVGDALTLTRGNYTVEVQPVYLAREQDGETVFVESERARVTVRTDTKAELGAVGMDYTPIQNRDAFGILQPLLDEGLLRLETGGQLRGGADAWMLGRFDLSAFGEQAREVFGTEGVQPYALVANNHSGRRGVLLSLTPIRVVCANTLGAAERDGAAQQFTVRHTRDVEAKVVEAAHNLFAGIVARSETIAAQYRLLRAHHLDTALFRSLVLDAVAPDPRTDPQWNPEARMAGAVVERWERKTTEVTRLWLKGDGHTGDGSAWEAYNGAVQALDHDRELFPTRSGVYRTASLMGGALAQIKQRVLNNLVENAALALNA